MANELSFTKMTGAGNDFVVLDRPGLVLSGEDIVRLCDRKYGIGADGVMIMRAAVGGDLAFSVDFYNSDGSTGMLCGNGARCILEFARLSGRVEQGRDVSFAFAGSPYSGRVLGPSLVKFEFSPRYELEAVEDLELDGRRLPGHFVDVGSLHFVIETASIPKDAHGGRYPSLDDVPVFELGRRIRYHPRFAPRGVNVNFISLDAGKVGVRTYERGVEDETLACGTGSTATALVCWTLGKSAQPVTIVTRGGEELVIGIGTERGEVTSLTLTGPAKKVFSGTITL